MKRQTRLPFLDIMINESGKTFYVDIYNKPTYSKRQCPIYQHIV